MIGIYSLFIFLVTTTSLVREKILYDYSTKNKSKAKEDFLFRQQDVLDIKPYNLEVITREGLDTQKMKDLIWNGKLPTIDYNGTYYRIEHTLILEKLKRLSRH